MIRTVASRPGTQAANVPMKEYTAPRSAARPAGAHSIPDPNLRDGFEDTPAWGGGIHTWCQCGCTGNEDHFRNANYRVDFPFIDE